MTHLPTHLELDRHKPRFPISNRMTNGTDRKILRWILDTLEMWTGKTMSMEISKLSTTTFPSSVATSQEVKTQPHSAVVLSFVLVACCHDGVMGCCRVWLFFVDLLFLVNRTVTLCILGLGVLRAHLLGAAFPPIFLKLLKLRGTFSDLCTLLC